MPIFQEKVRYILLRHRDSDPEKKDAIKTFTVPDNLEQIWTFLGFSGSYKNNNNNNNNCLLHTLATEVELQVVSATENVQLQNC